MTEWSVPLKEKYNITHSSPGNKQHGSPRGAAGGTAAFGQEQEQEQE